MKNKVKIYSDPGSWRYENHRWDLIKKIGSTENPEICFDIDALARFCIQKNHHKEFCMLLDRLNRKGLYDEARAFLMPMLEEKSKKFAEGKYKYLLSDLGCDPEVHQEVIQPLPLPLQLLTVCLYPRAIKNYTFRFDRDAVINEIFVNENRVHSSFMIIALCQNIANIAHGYFESPANESWEDAIVRVMGFHPGETINFIGDLSRSEKNLVEKFYYSGIKNNSGYSLVRSAFFQQTLQPHYAWAFDYLWSSGLFYKLRFIRQEEVLKTTHSITERYAKVYSRMSMSCPEKMGLIFDPAYITKEVIQRFIDHGEESFRKFLSTYDEYEQMELRSKVPFNPALLLKGARSKAFSEDLAL